MIPKGSWVKVPSQPSKRTLVLLNIVMPSDTEVRREKGVRCSCVREPRKTWERLLILEHRAKKCS